MKDSYCWVVIWYDEPGPRMIIGPYVDVYLKKEDAENRYDCLIKVKTRIVRIEKELIH